MSIRDQVRNAIFRYEPFSDKQATAAINAFLAAAAEEGWRMAKDEATEEMINGAAQTRKMQAVNAAMTLAQIHGAKFEATSWHDSALADAYRAMHAAAPEFEWDK